MPNIMEMINIDDQYKFPHERPVVAIELSLATKRSLWANVFALSSGLFDPQVDPKQVFVEVAKVTITTCLRNGYDNLWIVCDDPAPQAAQPVKTESVIRDLGVLLHRTMLQEGVESEHLFAIIFYCHNQIAYLNGKLSDEL